MCYCVFDTETIGLDKPFCYNIGYEIKVDNFTLLRREFIVEQIWHNSELFSTAYYADKRPIYIQAMRAHNILMEKFGYITQQMIRDFRNYNVTAAYAYNSSFDDRVFNYNCDWFKCINPFDNIPIFDIRPYAQKFLCVSKEFFAYCEKNERFTENMNYSTTAETIYGFIRGNPQFIEAHTALDDSRIEGEILWECIQKGAQWETKYFVPNSIPRIVPQRFTVKDKDSKTELFSCTFYSKRFTNERNTITLQTNVKETT